MVCSLAGSFRAVQDFLVKRNQKSLRCPCPFAGPSASPECIKKHLVFIMVISEIGVAYASLGLCAYYTVDSVFSPMSNAAQFTFNGAPPHNTEYFTQ